MHKMLKRKCDVPRGFVISWFCLTHPSLQRHHHPRRNEVKTNRFLFYSLTQNNFVRFARKVHTLVFHLQLFTKCIFRDFSHYIFSYTHAYLCLQIFYYCILLYQITQQDNNIHKFNNVSCLVLVISVVWNKTSFTLKMSQIFNIKSEVLNKFPSVFKEILVFVWIHDMHFMWTKTSTWPQSKFVAESLYLTCLAVTLLTASLPMVFV